MAKKETYYGLLKNISLSDLKTLKVAVKRNYITTSAPPGPLERGIDDPRDIIPCVHYRKGFENSYGIFDREGILVNQEKRSVLADANILEEDERSNSQSGSRKRSRSRSSSGHNRRSIDQNRERSPLRRSSKDREKNRNRSKDRGDTREWRRPMRSPERSKRQNSKERGDEYRGRSRSPIRRERIPSPKPSHSNERRRSRSRYADYYKNRRTRSHSTERYKSNRRSVSPVAHRKSRSPKRRSISAERDRRRIHRQGDYKDRSSRSPGYSDRKRYLERHRSRSSSRPRIVKDRRRSKSSHRSRSPRRFERDRMSSDTRRSSRSPRPSTSRHVSSHRRSPTSERDKYKKHRSRSRSPHKEPSPVMDYHSYYEGIPGAEYWIPNQIRPRLPLPGMPRFFPPPQPFYPRDMSAGFFLPPRYSPGFLPFRPRLPVYNSKKTLAEIKAITGEGSSTSTQPAGTENKANNSSTSSGTTPQTTDANIDKDFGGKNTENEPEKSTNDSRS